MNRMQDRKNKEQQARIRKDISKSELIADIKRLADVARNLISDERHNEYKEFWQDIVLLKQQQLDCLGDISKTTDEYTLRSLILTTEIKTILWMITTPEKFIKKEEQDNKGGQ